MPNVDIPNLTGIIGEVNCWLLSTEVVAAASVVSTQACIFRHRVCYRSNPVVASERCEQFNSHFQVPFKYPIDCSHER